MAGRAAATAGVVDWARLAVVGLETKAGRAVAGSAAQVEVEWRPQERLGVFLCACWTGGEGVEGDEAGWVVAHQAERPGPSYDAHSEPTNRPRT